LVVLLVLIVVKQLLFNQEVDETVVEQQEEELQQDDIRQVESPLEVAPTLYYAFFDEENSKLRIAQIHIDEGEVEDIFTLEQNEWRGLEIGDKYEIGQNIAWRNNILYTLDVRENKFEKFFEIDTNLRIVDVDLSHDSQKIAYINFGEDDSGSVLGRGLIIHDIDSGVSREIAKLDFDLEYSSAKIIGWSQDDTRVVVQESAGAIGFSGETIIIFDAITGDIIEQYDDSKSLKDVEEHLPYSSLLTPKFLTGILSPDGYSIAYTDCGAESFIDGFPYVTCSESQALYVYDLNTKETRLVYENVPEDNFISTHQLYDYSWYGDDFIIFANFEGISKLDLKGGDIESIYGVDIENDAQIRERAPRIINIIPPFVVFSTDVRHNDVFPGELAEQFNRIQFTNYHLVDAETKEFFKDILLTRINSNTQFFGSMLDN